MNTSATDNLFSCLFKYRPRDAVAPEENFVTEAFAYLLRADTGVGAELLSRLLNTPFDAQTLKVDTQWVLPSRRRPDMVIQDNSNRVYCENKIHAPFDESQIKDYCVQLNESKDCPDLTKKSAVAFTGEFAPPPGPLSYEWVTWEKVRETILELCREYGQRDLQTRSLWHQFCGFLKERGMTREPIDRDAVAAVGKYVDAIGELQKLHSQVQNLLDHVDAEIRKKYSVQPVKGSRRSGSRGTYAAAPEIQFGRIVLQLNLDYSNAGLAAVVSLKRPANQSESAVAFDAACKCNKECELDQNSNYGVKRAMSSSFYETGAMEQVNQLVSAVEDMVKPWVDAGFLARNAGA